MLRLLILCMALLIPVAASAQGEAVRIPKTPALSVTLYPAGVAETGGYVMGQIVLKARIVSRYPFEALSLDPPAIEGAEVRTLMRPRTRKIRSYGGDGFVFETSLAIFPTASGSLIIPPIRAAGRVETPEGEEITFDHETPPQTLPVAGIPASYDDPWWLVSPEVTLSEAWSKPLDQVRDGDVIERIVTIKAIGVAAEQLPLLDHRQTRHVVVQRSDVANDTKATADGLIGISEQRLTIKMGDAATIYLSPLSLTYWDPVSRSIRKAAAPGHRIEPLAADGDAIAKDLMDAAISTHRNEKALLFVLLSILAAPFLLGLVWFAALALPTLPDLKLARACRETDKPVDLYRAVLGWSRADGSPDTKGLAEAPDGAQIQRLRKSLFSRDEEQVDSASLWRELLAASRRRRFNSAWARVNRWFAAIVPPASRFTHPSN